MFTTAFRRVLFGCSAISVALLGLGSESVAQLPPAAPLAIQSNSNRVPAGKLENGVLTLHLQLRQGSWYPEAETGPTMRVYAFAEEDGAPQVPGPFIRVPEGTEIHLTVRNQLPITAVMHGLHAHPGDKKDTTEVAPNETRELRFAAGAAGTYQYYASAGGDLQHSDKGRPFGEDSQLAGAFIVDPISGASADRVFVITLWRSGSDLAATPAHQVAVINGKSWPYTERLTYTADEPVRWRWINASDASHPMHMHGSYFRVDSAGDGESDRAFPSGQQPMVTTYLLRSGTSMNMYWTAPPGHWLFHCHFVPHISAEMTVANALADKFVSDEHGNHMAGMVLGIAVPGERKAVAAHGSIRKIRLLVRERPARDDSPAGFGYQVEEGHRLIPEHLAQPGPPLILERGRPVEITVVNELREPTTVHWHGMELDSYYDGVADWGAHGKEVTPMIKPGESFRVHFTPPRAGTFMYHTHLHDRAQLSGGLYGPLIVVESRTNFDPEHDHIGVLSRGGPGPAEGPALFNGSLKPPALHWRIGQRYRLRFVSIAAFDGFRVSLRGSEKLLQWKAIAKDGADLPPAQIRMQEAQQLMLAGETFDYEYRPTEAGNLQLEVSSLGVNVVQQIEIR
jgi:FtsP/CotA-like multicopper oxidase with cupredoxin domain